MGESGRSTHRKAVSLPSRLQELMDDLSELEDRQERFMVLIDFADRFTEVTPDIAERPFPEQHRVQRCESQAFVWAEQDSSNKVKFHFAVENPQGISAKAMAVILDETLSGEPPEAISGVTSDIVLKIFGRELSMGKGQGLMGMVELAKILSKRLTVENELKS